MKTFLTLAVGALLALPALPAAAQSAADFCARARDPARCEERQAALRTCGEMRGPEKQACLDASIPPVDCSKSKDPQHCEAAQKAKELCKGKLNKELKKCLREDQPRKKKQKRKKRPAA